jgi:hypothetical protein
MNDNRVVSLALSTVSGSSELRIWKSGRGGKEHL